MHPKINVVLLVGDRILDLHEPKIDYRTRKRTLIIVRRTLAEPKTALAGVMLEISFVRFRASIVTFKVERVVPFPLFCWDFGAIVESRGRKDSIWALPGPSVGDQS